MPAVPLQAEEFRQVALINTLASCQLFLGVHPKDLAEIAQFTLLKKLDRGEYLFREGDRAIGFYVVQMGGINVHRVSATGKEQVIYVFRANQSFAEVTLATEMGYPADARAVEPSTVLLIQKDAFVNFLAKRPDISLRILAGMSQHLRVLVQVVEDLTLKDVESRFINWLLKQCGTTTSTRACTVRLAGTKRTLASELSTSSETLSRTFAKLKQAKLLEVKGNILAVKNPAELHKLLLRNLGERA